MSHRRWRLILNSLTSLALLASGAVLVAALLWPVRSRLQGAASGDDSSSTGSSHFSPSSSDTTSGTLLPGAGVERFESLWSLNLRRPLFDRLEGPAPESAPPPPMRLTLAGTVIEPDQATALVVDSQGRTRFLRVGQVLEEAEVMAIAPEAVTVWYYGQTHELVRPTSQDTPLSRREAQP